MFERAKGPYMNLFTGDGGKTYFSLGTIAAPVGEHAVSLARRAAEIGDDTRISVLGSGVVGITFEPPLPADQAEAFALTMARELNVQTIQQIAVERDAHEIIGTLLTQS